MQHEAVGDLYFAADNFGAAVESYAAALRAVVDRTPADRLSLMLRLARAYFLRADYGASLDVLAECALSGPYAGSVRVHGASGGPDRPGADRARTVRPRPPLRALCVPRVEERRRSPERGEIGVTLGLCYARLGRNSDAIEWLQDAAATYRRIDDPDGLVTALNNLGLVYKNLREWREATRFLEQALKIDERAGLYSRMRAHHNNLGLIRYYLGQWDLAEEDFRRSLQIARDTGHRQGEAATLMALGRSAEASAPARSGRGELPPRNDPRGPGGRRA